MTAYEALTAEYDYLIIKEKRLNKHGGLYSNKCIWLKKSESEKRKVCLLAEEIGHHLCTVGNILDQTKIINQKQEHKARAWAFRKLLPYDDIVFALKYGYRTTYDLAEHFGLDEEFVKDCLRYYRFI